MYRHKIHEYYDRLSRSYRSVADFVLSNYYEVSFMTAAQLLLLLQAWTPPPLCASRSALATTVILNCCTNIRAAQVKAEIYLPRMCLSRFSLITPPDIFRALTDLEADNLKRLQAYDPPEKIEQVVRLLDAAQSMMIIAEGYATWPSLRLSNCATLVLPPMARATIPCVLPQALAALTPETLMIGISGTGPNGRDVAAGAMQYTHSSSPRLPHAGHHRRPRVTPVNRMADLIIYTPSDAVGPFSSLVALVAALGAMVALGRARAE